MKKLGDIQEYVQNIAEVIKSVIGVDVTIMDSDNIRIAATGKYCGKIGQKGGERSVFIKAMKNCESYIINHPRYDQVCTECGCREDCIELAEVCSPILTEQGSLNGLQAIGVIGLVALSEKQRDNLLNNSSNLLDFLKKMGDLLGSKLLEAEILEKEKIIHKQIETIIDSMDDGVIAIDEDGNVLYTNRIIKRLEDKWGETLLGDILEEINVECALRKREEIKNKQLVIKDLRFFYSMKPIELDRKLFGHVVLLRSIKDINRIINDVSTSFIDTGFDDIVGDSDEINAVKDLSLKACKGDSTILITGESGTGKELFARAIHHNSNRKGKPFIAINCAAIPENLLESELFGYEEGSFTGARKGGKIGKFELANGGTIFLDEIGDMPLHLQTKLLRVLQERTIERIGSSYNSKIDIRIIAATHKDLNGMVEHEEFRRDLYYRLNVIPIKIPPLRDRKKDIDILSGYFLNKCNNKLGKNAIGFSKEVIDLFHGYGWPGNIREMENVVEYAVNMENSNIIGLGNLPPRFRDFEQIPPEFDLRTLEKNAIVAALSKSSNRNEAARLLGIGRATLFRKIKEYGI